MKEFDYYIFVDYSEGLIGYSIIKDEKLKELSPKISRFRHYRGSRGRKIYLSHIKNTIHRNKIKSYFDKIKIKERRDSIDIFIDVLEFVKEHNNCIIFICVDDYQYKKFRKMADLLDRNKTKIVKESQLKRGTAVYQVSLVLDNLLNIERRKQ